LTALVNLKGDGIGNRRLLEEKEIPYPLEELRAKIEQTIPVFFKAG
jgi:hypothetical protein